MLKLHNARFAVFVVLQVEFHVDELLISAYTRIEAFRVSPVFNKAHFFIKRNRACVIRNDDGTWSHTPYRKDGRVVECRL